MSALLDFTPPGTARPTRQRAWQNDPADAQRKHRRETAVQLVYAHLPPATVLAVEQHLRAQTQIEQRAEQLWFAAIGRPVGALNDWLRAEREVVNKLCDALLQRNQHEHSATP